MGRSEGIVNRYGATALTSRRCSAALDLPPEAMTHWSAADDTDPPKDWHADM